MAYAASVAGGNPLAERALSDRFGITRPAAKKIRAGQAPTDAPAAATSPAAMATAATSAAAGALNGKPAEGG
jgi:hypothetical protein